MLTNGRTVIAPGDTLSKRESQPRRSSGAPAMTFAVGGGEDGANTGALRDCVLVVDDEVLISELWCMILEDMQLDVCATATTAASAIALANEHRPKLVLMDVRLEGPSDGVDAALAIQRTVGSKIIFVTGSRDAPTLDRITAARAAGVLFKPLREQQLQLAVAAAINA